MRVFRCITTREIINMYKTGKFESYPAVKGENTHNYEEGKEYIHFFRYSQDAETYTQECGIAVNPIDNYTMFMVANIPNEVLKQYSGYGYYSFDKEPLIKSYLLPIAEYAIPHDVFQKDWIVTINRYIEHKYESNKEEYQRYLEFIAAMQKYNKGIDENMIGNYLLHHDLETLLDVKDDDRTEKQIKEDELKELMKIFPLTD